MGILDFSLYLFIYFFLFFLPFFKKFFEQKVDGSYLFQNQNRNSGEAARATKLKMGVNES